MNNPQPSPEDSLSFDQEFSHELDSVEQSLSELKQRYSEVQTAQIERSDLLEQEKVLNARRSREPALKRDASFKAELQQIQKRIEELELILESHLLSWSSFKEPFWQIVRFGGLGIVLGWFLHSCVKG